VNKWGTDSEVAGKINTINAFPSSLSFLPQSGKQVQYQWIRTPLSVYPLHNVSFQVSELFALSCTDGTFRFVARSGREEKKVTAHEGAVIKIKWSHDGSALLTAGEDGEVKIWSKSGNLRSTLVATPQSVYAMCWGPDDDQVVIATGKNLLIKTVQTSKKNLEWPAHEGVVLCVDWNVANGNIVSGGEDCIYKVWDSFGRQLYASRVMEQVITAVAWSPNGDNFAVGSHNMLRLCDKTGWAHCRERTTCGSIVDISWTPDGTQFAGACGSGEVLFAQVVERKFEWKNTEVTIVEPRKIRVQDLVNETLEDMDFARDRVVDIGLGHEYMVVTTTTQCYVYSIHNLNTPIIFDIRGPPHFIHMCKRHFLTLDLINGLQVISFEGKILCNLKFQGLRPEYLTKDMVALSPDTVAVIDSVDQKRIQILDASSGRIITKITHSAEVVFVALNQHSLGPQERLLAFIDKNRDLFVGALGNGVTTGSGNNVQIVIPTAKLHSHVDSFLFNDETDVIVGLSDGNLNVWMQPSVMFIDKDLLPSTMTSVDASDMGRNAQIIAFTGSRVSIRRVDGSMVYHSVPTDISILYDLFRASRWDEATRLCRHQKSPTLWGSLAAVALSKRQLDTVEIALCELNEVAKVEYIQFIKSIPSDEGRQAEIMVYRRQIDEAERILLQASPPLIYRAIKMNLRLFRFARALALAMKHRSHVDTVLAYRSKYLQAFDRAETDKNYLQVSSQVMRWLRWVCWCCVC
jgi:intraflagellar transport protein 80